MSLRSISGDEAARTAWHAFWSVFETGHPFRRPFRNEVEKRTLIFPTDGYDLAEEQFAALADGAAGIGEFEAFVSNSELPDTLRDASDWETREHFVIDLRDFRSYEELSEHSPFGIVRSAIYSTHGTWGLLISNEFHAVAGGPSEFVRDVVAHLPDPEPLANKLDFLVAPPEPWAHDTEERMVSMWLNYWKENRAKGDPVDWVPDLIQHLMGAERARAILIASRWSA